MLRRTLVLVVLATASILTAAACGGSEDAAPTATEGPVVFAGETLDGVELTSADYAGQDVILWFWAPW